jgi:hypothetical protein
VAEVRRTCPGGTGDGGIRRVPRRRTKLEKFRAIATATRLFVASLLVGGQRSSRCDGRGDIRWRERGDAARLALGSGEPWWVGWGRGGRVCREWADADSRLGTAICEAAIERDTRREAGLIALSLLVGAMLALYASLLLASHAKSPRRRGEDPTHYAAPAERPEPGRTSSIAVGQIVSGGGY